jgi:2,3-bisphosphoglycerate-dependent phosphoglycerate mutase
MIPFTESLKNTYDRVIPYYEKEIKKQIQENKNILISAHGNSLRALCKYLFKISDQKINELEIPTGNPLIIEFDNNLVIKKYYYLDESRAKNIIFNQ